MNTAIVAKENGMKLAWFTGGCSVLAAFGAVSAMAQQAVTDTYDFQKGDLIKLGGNSYPPDAVYRIDSCEPASKSYRQCQVYRQSPDPETHLRPLTMNNYIPGLTLVGKADAAAPPAVPRAPATASNGNAPPVATTTGGECPRSAYGGPVPGSRPASAALFRQKVTDSITMAAYGRFWYGVRLENFTVGTALTNTVGRLPGGGASRVNSGAPVGARMYPVSTTMSVCEGAPNGSSSWRTSAKKKYLCFVSANNEWTCGASN